VLTLIVLTACLFGWNGKMASCVNCCVLRVGALPIGLLIFVVATAAALLLSIGTLSGTFCENPDASSLNLISSMHSGKGASQNYAIAKAYIMGEGVNPLLAKVENVDAMVGQIQKNMWMIHPLLATLSGMCPDLGKADIPDTLKKTESLTSFALKTLERSNVYAYYSRTVRVGVCNHAVSGVGWLWLAYTISALICLPVVCNLAHRYLSPQTPSYKSFNDVEAPLSTKLPEESSPAKRPWYACCSRRQVRIPNSPSNAGSPVGWQR